MALQDEGSNDQPFHPRRHAGYCLCCRDICWRSVRACGVVRRPVERACRHQERSVRPSLPIRRDDREWSGLLRRRRAGQPDGARSAIRQRHCASVERPAIRRRHGAAFAQHWPGKLARPRPERKLRRRMERESRLSAHAKSSTSLPHDEIKTGMPGTRPGMTNHRAATRLSYRRRPLHKLRICSGFAAALICMALLACPPLEWAAAQAQTHAAAKKKGERKAATPKAAPQQQEERAPFTAQDEDAAVIPGIPDARVWGDSDSAFARLLPQASGPWLAISGGGSDGAYGAGVLTGWSEAGTRPQFAVVTGVSIGALIAPFAFLGSRYDEDLHKNFTSIGAADIFEDRTTRESLFDYWPLKRLIEQRVTPALVSEIAAEHARGRRLWVATTNLDAGRRVIWNMGAIAAHGEQGLRLFRDVLLASSAIPGFFSPVPIEVEVNGKKFHELHGDGTLSLSFFVMPDSMLSPPRTRRTPPAALCVWVTAS